MSKVVFIKANSPEIRNKLKEAGFSVCACASFDDSVWLDYHPKNTYYRDIHGCGYCDPGDWDEKFSPLERIKMRLEESGYYSKDREFFDNVDEFLKKYQNERNSSLL